MSLILVGLNHDTAPLPVRERVAYSKEEAVTVLRALKAEHAVPQALLLSTCNRTELYALVPDATRDLPRVRDALFVPRLQNGDSRCLYARENASAVEHLFRVACGLDSMVLGEQEILGQVKTAYELSRDAETVGALFHRLASQAMHVGKRARTETRIGHGAISVAFAAVELAEKVFQRLDGKGVLLIGAGENGALCAQHLVARNARPLLIANRTLEKAEALADRMEGETVSMDRLVEAMARVDIVVSTTGASGSIVDVDMVREVMRLRDGKALVLVDIAVPRDVDPGVDRIPNVFRFDLDTLKSVVEQSVARRHREVPAVERLIQTEVAGFMKWWESLASGPVIRDLHAAFEAIRSAEVAKNAKRFQDADHEQLEIFSRNLLRKVLMAASMEMKGYRQDDPVAMERLAAVREVFRLDAEGEGDDGDASR
jgi:glutamyl-tRNA reductase